MQHPPPDTRRYRLACPCGWHAGPTVGILAAAAALRTHPCPPALAGPVAERAR